MFDRHVHIVEGRPSTVTVHEHRAPTDESVRILRDLEAAAREKITTAIRLENSPIDAVIHGHIDALSQRRQYLVLIRINGKSVEVRREFNMLTPAEEIAEGLLAAVSERIAALLLADAFRSVPAHLWSPR